MKPLHFDCEPGVRIQHIIPAGNWVAVEHWPDQALFEIQSVICWALGDDEDRDFNGQIAHQFIKGAVSPANVDGAHPVELVDDEGNTHLGPNGFRFVGYFPSETVAVARIRRDHAPAGKTSVITLVDGSTATVTGQADAPEVA